MFGKHWAVGLSQLITKVSVFKSNSVNAQTNKNRDMISRLCFQPQASFYNGMSDQAIESYRFVPEGYKWVDHDSNESYTGKHVVLIDYGTGGAIREINRRLGNHDTEFTENDSALTELADIISKGGIQNG